MARRKWIIGTVSAGVAVGVVSMVVWAAPMRHLGPLRDHPLLRQFVLQQMRSSAELRHELNLTDEQRAQLRGLVAGQRDELAPAVDALIADSRALRAEVLSETPTEEAIRADAAKVGESLGNLAVLASGLAQDARQALTPEQLATLAAHRESRDQAVDDLLERVRQRAETD